jgi:hypothetical protein
MIEGFPPEASVTQRLTPWASQVEETMDLIQLADFTILVK